MAGTINQSYLSEKLTVHVIFTTVHVKCVNFIKKYDRIKNKTDYNILIIALQWGLPMSLR